ncbi:hypothetical protein MKZ38_007741 [Zalerion maritima]|uniref:Uncharacterized protein n=1 Tax=Zalerion maritima TaxID=339359 RepID=A0AAD5RHE6_9PEZI|nr:hypothetical protein MKZ38_007741 [Zalerion maritima]
MGSSASRVAGPASKVVKPKSPVNRTAHIPETGKSQPPATNVPVVKSPTVSPRTAPSPIPPSPRWANERPGAFKPGPKSTLMPGTPNDPKLPQASSTGIIAESQPKSKSESCPESQAMTESESKPATLDREAKKAKISVPDGKAAGGGTEGNTKPDPAPKVMSDRDAGGPNQKKSPQPKLAPRPKKGTKRSARFTAARTAGLLNKAAATKKDGSHDKQDEVDELWAKFTERDLGSQVGGETSPESEPADQDAVEAVEEADEDEDLEEEQKQKQEQIKIANLRFANGHHTVEKGLVTIFRPLPTRSGDLRGHIVARSAELLKMGPVGMFPVRSVHVPVTDGGKAHFPTPLFNEHRSYRSVSRYVLSPDVLLTDGTPSDQVCALFTDGSFSYDTRNNTTDCYAGWSFDTGSEVISGPMHLPRAKGKPVLDNNMVELSAIWRALDWLHRTGEVWPTIVVITDSEACTNSLANLNLAVGSTMTGRAVRSFIPLLKAMQQENGLKKLLLWKVVREVVEDCDVAADWERMRIQILKRPSSK